MDKLDTWIHVAELIIVVLIAPGVRTLVKTLISLRDTAVTLSTTMTSVQSTLQHHVEQDTVQFAELQRHVAGVDGNVREMKGRLGRMRGGD